MTRRDVRTIGLRESKATTALWHFSTEEFHRRPPRTHGAIKNACLVSYYLLFCPCVHKTTGSLLAQRPGSGTCSDIPIQADIAIHYQPAVAKYMSTLTQVEKYLGCRSPKESPGQGIRRIGPSEDGGEA